MYEIGTAIENTTSDYLPFGGLFPRPEPDGFPIWLGPFGGAMTSNKDLTAMRFRVCSNI